MDHWSHRPAVTRPTPGRFVPTGGEPDSRSAFCPPASSSSSAFSQQVLHGHPGHSSHPTSHSTMNPVTSTVPPLYPTPSARYSPYQSYPPASSSATDRRYSIDKDADLWLKLSGLAQALTGYVQQGLEDLNPAVRASLLRTIGSIAVDVHECTTSPHTVPPILDTSMVPPPLLPRPLDHNSDLTAIRRSSYSGEPSFREDKEQDGKRKRKPRRKVQPAPGVKRSPFSLPFEEQSSVSPPVYTAPSPILPPASPFSLGSSVAGSRRASSDKYENYPRAGSFSDPGSSREIEKRSATASLPAQGLAMENPSDYAHTTNFPMQMAPVNADYEDDEDEESKEEIAASLYALRLPPGAKEAHSHNWTFSSTTGPPRKKKRGRTPADNTNMFCFHCGATDTPEWRRGPAGPKTLCNACGLQYAKKLKLALLRQRNEAPLSLILNTPSQHKESTSPTSGTPPSRSPPYHSNPHPSLSPHSSHSSFAPTQPIITHPPRFRAGSPDSYVDNIKPDERM